MRLVAMPSVRGPDSLGSDAGCPQCGQSGKRCRVSGVRTVREAMLGVRGPDSPGSDAGCPGSGQSGKRCWVSTVWTVWEAMLGADPHFLWKSIGDEMNG